MHLLITSHLFHIDYFWHTDCGPLTLHSLYFLLHTILLCSLSVITYDSHQHALYWVSRMVVYYIYYFDFLCYTSILTKHLHSIHTHLFLFTVDNIWFPEQSPSDSVDPFITQSDFIILTTQDQDNSQEAGVDLPETHSNYLTTPSFEDHDDDLTNAQRNLLHDLPKHKTNVLKHD